MSRKSVAKERRVHSVNGGLGRVIVRHRWKSCGPEEGRADQIFWLRFGRRYLILELVFIF